MRPFRWIFGSFLLLFCLAIHFFSLNAKWVEYGYFDHFFVPFSHFLRQILGSFPFSIGDIFYGFLGFIMIRWLIGFLRKIFGKKYQMNRRSEIGDSLYSLFKFTCLLYIFFNVFWGINYNRPGIARQLGITLRPYDNSELKELNCLLIDKINDIRSTLSEEELHKNSFKELLAKTTDAYHNLAIHHPFLSYKESCLKPSLWGWLGNYAGFTGYYNPFSGEAQVNNTIPFFLQPYIACHEVAHQLGYAKEMEANFVGYLAASHSKDSLFRYSVYLELFLYANRNLQFADSLTAMVYRKDLTKGVKDDIKEWREFNLRHKNAAEPVIRWIYDQYLLRNRQPQGIYSYDEVTGFMVAYYKKFGKI